MTRTQFTSFARQVGVQTACTLAKSNHVSPTQVDLWLKSLDTYNRAHHYMLNDVVLAARSIH